MRRLLTFTVIVSALLVAGCGSGSANKRDETRDISPPRAPTAQEAREIRTVIAQLQQAIAARDAATVCTRLFAQVAVRVEELGGRSCVTSVRKEMSDEPPARLAVRSVTVKREHSCVRDRPCVDVDKATVAVTSSARGRRPFQAEGKLYNEQGSWRIDGTIADYTLPPDTGSSGSGGGSSGSGRGSSGSGGGSSGSGGEDSGGEGE